MSTSPELIESIMRSNQNRIDACTKWLETSEAILAPYQIRVAVNRHIEEQKESLEFWTKQKENLQAGE